MKYSWLLCCALLTACGSDHKQDKPSDSVGYEKLSSIYPYDATATYSTNIVACAKAYQEDSSCYVDILPPLSRTTSPLTLDEIMSRVVVSHEWMAERFQEILSLAPESALNIFAPLTAIVISHDIRPAFYSTSTGAIYLDPAYLWTTPAEFDTVDKKEDYRADFGNALDFVPISWYVDSLGTRISANTSNDYRTPSSLLKPLFKLLFHELGHANDYLPPVKRLSIQLPAGDVSFADLVDEAWEDGQTAQQQLERLANSTLLGLARVLYHGDTASATQTALTAQQVGAEFATESASDMYSYSHRAEDLAMLFEETMMYASFNAKRNIFFTSQPAKPDSRYCGDYLLGWGQKGRIGDASVKQRATSVIEQLLPAQAEQIKTQLAGLATPSIYSPGGSLCPYLSPTPSAYSSSGLHSGSWLIPNQLHYAPVRH